MPMVRVLPNAWRVCLVSAVTISFDASRNINRMVDMAPRVAPAISVATVTVVVTVDIMVSPFYAFLCLSMY